MNFSDAKTVVYNDLKNRREYYENAHHFCMENLHKDQEYNRLISQKKHLSIKIACSQSQEERTICFLQRDRIIRSINKRINELGYTQEQLEIKYECRLCLDSGQIGGEMCSCVKKRIRELMFSSNELNSNWTFSNSQEDAVNTKFYVNCQKIAEGTTQKKNLLVLGKNGRGKTYLVNAMGVQAEERGVDLMYMRAFQLGQIFLTMHLSENVDKIEYWRELIYIPLLIIDDLGSEQIYNNVTLPSLYNLIDERNNRGKTTYISTNLQLNQLKERYGERIFSRLCDKQYTYILELLGRDRRTGL